MPALYAHKKFGALVYKKLPRNIKKIVSENRDEFLIGLHGPDPLFFHVTKMGDSVAELGKEIHRHSFEEMYLRAHERVQKSGDKAELAYFIGFICHFVSDATIHPLVKDAMVETGLSHGKIETELERYILNEGGKKALKYPSHAHLPVLLSVAEHASVFYENVTPTQFLGCMAEMKAINGICRTTDKTARKVLTTVMDVTGNEDKAASLIMSKDTSGMALKYVKKMNKVLKEQVPTAVSEIVTFVDTIDGEAKVSPLVRKNFYGVE